MPGIGINIAIPLTIIHRRNHKNDGASAILRRDDTGAFVGEPQSGTTEAEAMGKLILASKAWGAPVSLVLTEPVGE